MKTIAAVIVLFLAAGFAVAPFTAAFADAPEGGPASCMGFEGSAVSPPGTSGEAPGGMPMVAQFFRANGLTTVFAQAHLGSHEACDDELL